MKALGINNVLGNLFYLGDWSFFNKKIHLCVLYNTDSGFRNKMVQIYSQKALQNIIIVSLHH